MLKERKGATQLVDDGGGATPRMHKGTELETALAKDGTFRVRVRHDGHEQWQGPHQGWQVWCVRLTTDGQVYGEVRLDKKVVGAVGAPRSRV